jgi:hypothetical protein
MSFFDAADRDALTLFLSRNDPLDSCYLTQEGAILYRVATEKASTGRGKPNALVTTVQRFRSTITPRTATSSDDPSPYYNNIGVGVGRRRTARRSRSSQTPSLATIDEDTDVTQSSSSSGEEYTNASTSIAGSRAPLAAGNRRRRGTVSDEIVCVATIERRPFSLAPVVLKFHGKEQVANKFLKREAPFSR